MIVIHVSFILEAVAKMLYVCGFLFSCSLQVLRVCSHIQNANTVNGHGISDFNTMIRTKKNEYVDKTLFIKEIMERRDAAILITRPPLFGKTLALSTLNHFLTDQHNDTEQLFAGFDIMQKDANLDRLRNTHMGKHPVIYLDLSEVRESTYRKSYAAIQEVISREFLRHKYAVDGKRFLTATFEAIVNKTADETKTAESINWLSRWVNSHYNGTNRVVVLIDGYDSPMRAGLIHRYYLKMAGFIGMFLHKSLRQNANVIKAVVTGVTPVAGEVLPYNLVTETILDNQYSTFFGFTRHEVTKLVGRTGKRSDVEKTLGRIDGMFNGYTFGSTRVFNPAAVTQYLFEDKVGGSIDLTSKAILKKLLGYCRLYPILTLQQVLEGEDVTREVSKVFNFDDIRFSRNEKAIWTCLLHSGYLTVFNVSDKVESWNLTLRVPNLEIHTEMARTLEQLPGPLGTKMPNYKRFVDDLVDGNFVSTKPVIESYLKFAGLFWTNKGRDDFAYLFQLFRGVELRYNTSLKYEFHRVPRYIWSLLELSIRIYPNNTAGVPIRVYFMCSSLARILGHKLKQTVCPFVNKINKNETEIVVLCNKLWVGSCLRHCSD